MSMFDDIALVRSEFDDSWLIESLEAVERLDALRKQYAALAPDWTQAPDWAQWCVIHANGLQYFCDEAEPFIQSHVIGWTPKGMLQEFYRELILPLGIDWRLCKWQRPKVAP